MTNDNGEFEVPEYKVNTFRYFHFWDNRPGFVVFKPGYLFRDGGFYTEGDKKNEAMVIKLPKADSVERYKNSSTIFGTEEISQLYVLSQYLDQKRLALGFDPYNLNNYYRQKEGISEYPGTILNYHDYEKKYVYTGQGTRTEGAANIRLKYKVTENQDELIRLIKAANLDFQVDTDRSIIFPVKNRKSIDEIIEKFENCPRIYFLYKGNYDLFAQLLEKHQIPYTTRTIPNVIGYGIIWDKENNENVEKIELEFFSNFLQKPKKSPNLT